MWEISVLSETNTTFKVNYPARHYVYDRIVACGQVGSHVAVENLAKVHRRTPAHPCTWNTGAEMMETLGTKKTHVKTSQYIERNTLMIWENVVTVF